MRDTSFDCLIDEYLVYCRSKDLREKTMNSYEQSPTSHWFLRHCKQWLHNRIAKAEAQRLRLLDTVLPERKCQASRVCSYGMRGRFFVFNQINLQNTPCTYLEKQYIIHNILFLKDTGG